MGEDLVISQLRRQDTDLHDFGRHVEGKEGVLEFPWNFLEGLMLISQLRRQEIIVWLR
jgi:hypothetical protein